MKKVEVRILNYFLFSVLLFFISCRQEAHHQHHFHPKVYEAAVAPDAATSEMINRVKAAFDAIDPSQVDYVLNEKKTKLLQQKLDSLEPGADMNLLLYDYADELLRAGNVNKSIAIFEDFLEFFEPRDIMNKAETIAEFKRKLSIAYMRKAELVNCIHNHNSESCIIPLSKKGQYSITEYSEKAIEYMEGFLDQFPRDYEVQYLLNIAYMTIGQYPDGVPKNFRIPPEYFEQADFPKFKDVAIDLGLDINEMSGGVCVDDFNNDGYLDLFISAWGGDNQIRFYENDQQGGFIDRTASTGLVGLTGGLNLKHADYNNDGHLDLIVLRGSWLEEFGKIPNSLIRNNGDGTFTDVTIEAGVYSAHPTQSAIWADYNLDGWIDLFIANESSLNGENQNELFLNNQDGTFKEVSTEAGITHLGYFKGATSGDINNDGYADIYLSDFNGENQLYINKSDSNTIHFELAGHSARVALPKESFSTWMFDYNNDGWEDIFVSAYSSGKITPVNMMMANMRKEFTKRRPKLYKNNGDGTFTNVSNEVGLTEPVTTMGCNFGDLDNDGFLDFYLATGDPSFFSIVPNKMYRNNQGIFEDVTYSGGFGHIQKGHAIGFGDLDLDGDQDIYAVMGGAYEGDVFQNMLLENPIGNNNNWITIHLQGTKSNRSAIGAKIILTIEDDEAPRKIYHTVGSGASFGGNSLLAEIGIGKAKVIKKMEITWPRLDRTPTVFNDVSINQIIKIVEGQSEIQQLKLAPASFKKTPY